VRVRSETHTTEGKRRQERSSQHKKMLKRSEEKELKCVTHYLRLYITPFRQWGRTFLVGGIVGWRNRTRAYTKL